MAREVLSPAAAALSQLASCNLKELHLKRADGSRILDSLHATCRAANVIPATAPDATPKERYLAVFDAALGGGLGCWILDYVEVVCADRHLTSNDPLEAYLLDGGFVKAWAAACLQRAEQAATSALTADMAFHSFQASGQLQAQLAQTRVLVAVLRALDRIRAAAAGGAVASGAGSAGTGDRLSVKEELRQAVLLEQAFQVMDWCARQGLAEPRTAAAGRFGSYPEWSRAVNARRARAAPRPLFLDSLLQSLSLSGAYPASSVQHMLHTLLLVVRDPEPAAWAAKLALLSYFLLDAGVLEQQQPQQGLPLGAAPAAGGAVAAAGGAAAGGGEARVEAALEELRRTFRLSAADVGVWQCNYLLDCAVPDGPDGAEDLHLARACALLPSCVTPALPFAFIEALLALGRPGVALAVDRGQSGSEASGNSNSNNSGGAAASGSGRPCRTLAQATTLLDTRLRCGLMTEAFMLLRQHVSDLAARLHAAGGGAGPGGYNGGDGGRAELEEHTRVLLGRLAEWAAAQDEAGAAAAAAAAGGSTATLAAAASTGWLNRLTELPLNATEESVLVSWLAGEAEAGRPAGDFLPLFFLQRGRVNEATAAWRRWDARQAALAAAGRRRSPVSDLVAAALDAAHCGGLPGPLRNVMVPAPAPGAEQPVAAAGQSGVPDLAPGQGAVGILAGLLDHMSPDQPLAVLPFHGAEPPPLVSRAVQLPAPHITAAQQAAAAAAASRGGAVGTAGAAAAVAPNASQPQAPQSQQPFVGMPLQLPAAAPFRAPPPTPGPDAFGAGGYPQGGFFRSAPGGGGSLGMSGGGAGVGGGAGAGGAGGLLFSVGAGAVAAAPAPGGGVGQTALGGLAAARSTKRYKPNDWF
ncbi:hypothetical protein HYH02_012794 [Chlamydomonas schloesseri]|uniref:ELYS-like domain-containing protein n=1 Tax=Chlamydomonas schloesseri TaxID=2026947 RepID=A0A835W1Y1_9CHLO|nr:hypothetical protein HYH02_012794 [Chlamydomonas schloesseri]|eukprot:KAG2433091.1 hypothetical protein HYH02_012794 [Chlamydomonas schloesseri]